MSDAQSLNFIKMNAVGNDFIIFDARKTKINLSTEQITKLSQRHNIGCDQLVIIKNSENADCLMQIYNSDGSKSGACGNATRCVAGLIFEENEKLITIKIEVSGQILHCTKNQNLISVNMGNPKFLWNEIPLAQEIDSQNLEILGYKFLCMNIGNPHAVSFIDKKLTDEEFFKIGKNVENHQLFPEKTNVEFAKIINDNLIEVRVFERGVGETLACGSGACAVGALAIKHNLIKTNKVTIRFKGGDIIISLENNSVIMTGDYNKIFTAIIDESFFG